MNYKMNEISSLKLLRNLYCASCNLQFFIKDVTLKGSRCPMLLHCGHSVCESCLQQSIKTMKIVTCLQCGFISFLESEETISECFPINLHEMGSLVLQYSKLEKEKKLAFLTKKDGNFNYAFKNQSDITLKSDLSDNVCEECSLIALWYCENCKCNFCEICWSRVHGSTKSLMKHCKTSAYKVETVKRVLKKCLEHETQDLEFYCRGCSIAVCSHCVILQHQGEGHCPITLKEKNMEIISKVKAAAEEAKKISKRMKQTLEKIELIQSSKYNSSFLDLENKITRKFSRIHGILQLQEERLLKKLHERSKERENCIRALRIRVEKELENVESLMNEFDIVLKKPQESDLTELHGELEKVLNLPCYLVSLKSGNDEAKIAFDESLIELLQTYCTIDLPSDKIFELRSGADLPEDYELEPLNVSDSDEKLKFVPKEGSESCVSDIDILSKDSSRDLANEEADFNDSNFPKKSQVFLKRKSYSVRVTYIKNPGEFYVTLNSQRPKQQAIDKRASQFANFSSVIGGTFAKGEIYLVKYEVDNKWYRARIIEVFEPKKIEDEENVLIYYIDYGNSETVPVSRLRPIPLDILEESPLAVKCKLFNCVPKNGSWCRESAKIMEKILNGYTATMFVMNSQGNCLEVDLSVIYPEGQIGRDIVSVRDALLFLEFSSFVQGPKISRHATALKYLHQCLPSVGEAFDAVITHVNSPSDFYVQKTKQDASYLCKLTIDLQNFYGDNSERGIVYNPTIGMPCAAIFSADQRWYRAKIVDIPGKKMVTVFYVDYGNKETISWTGIRKLKECFVKRPPLALNCSMAGILPVDTFWNTQAKSYLEKCVMMRNCRVYIHGRPSSKKKLKVLLYKQVNRKEICVNNLFVNMGYAVKSNPNCLWMLKPQENAKQKEQETPPKAHDETPNNETDEDQETSSAENDPLNKTIFLKERKRSKLNAKELREIHEYEKKQGREEASSTEDVENETDEYNNIFKVKVQILSAESPSCIYVTFPALMEEFENLQLQLDDFYRDSSPTEVKEWATDSVCAVFDSEKNCWYRGSVLCTLPGDRVKVFLKDVAQVSTKPTSAIRELDSSFTRYAACAVKCHLADIGPPGEQWPSVSSEYLLNEFDNYKEIYMNKRGQIENRSLPVELWVQKIVPKGALEPTTKEWVTLNQLLVNQGLAIPKLPKLWYGNNSADYKDKTYDEKDSLHPSNERTNVEDSSDEKNFKAVSEVSYAVLPSLSSRWEPPQPLKRSRFIGLPTYVDHNALIYIYDLKEDGEKLKMVHEILLQEYENSKPNPEDHFWSPGQLCIARYHVDNSWYRGVILQINEDITYDVLFVDYGNVEVCLAQDLRKRIKTHEIPILTHKFQLQGIDPISEDGNWPVSVIDNLHSFVVDKKCEVNVLKTPLDPSETHLISLKLIEDEIEVGTFLVEQGLASARSLKSDSSYASDPEDFSLVSSNANVKLNNDSGLPGYNSLIISESHGFFVEVTFVKSETNFFANIVDDEILSTHLKKIFKGFNTLQQTLTEECHLQPPLEKLVKGQPCCCENPTNNKWCRGEIVSFLKKENSACVFYVDYGNVEILSKDLIHECKREWMDLPKMAVEFRLANIKKSPNVKKSVYMKSLTSCLRGTVLFAKIFNKDDVLEVSLSVNRSGPLAYQEMIDKKLMTFI